MNDAGGDHDDQVLAINKSAQSVGWSSHPVTGNGIQDEAVLWTSTDKSTVLTTPAGTLYSLATCINNNGIIGGFVYNGNANGEFATEWSAATGAIHWSVAGYNALLAVNSSGEALASNISGGFDLLSAATGAATPLQDPIIGGITEPFDVLALNDVGKSVGECSNTALSLPAAVEWSATGVATILSNLTGTKGGAAVAINKSGDIAGYNSANNGTVEAVSWNAAGKITNLQALLGATWSDTQATGVPFHGIGTPLRG